MPTNQRRREILRIPLEQAKAQVWTVVSVKDDWTTVFADAPSPA